MDTPLVMKARGPDRHVVVVTGDNARTFDISPGEYAALAMPGAGPPPGTTRPEWEGGSCRAYGGVPDYGGVDRLAHGEIAEDDRAFRIGVRRRDGRTIQVDVPKADVIIDRTGGITLTPRTAWPTGTEIVAVVAGVLTRVD